MEKLINLYRQWRGESPVHIEKLQMAGSNREYYRMADADGATVIGVIGTSRDENHAFIYLSGHFTRRRLPVPQILAASEDESGVVVIPASQKKEEALNYEIEREDDPAKEDRLSEEILKNTIHSGQTVLVDFDGKELTFANK